MPSITGLMTTVTLNTKATGIENKISDISNLIKKVVMGQKLKRSRLNISQILNLMSFQMRYLMQK